MKVLLISLYPPTRHNIGGPSSLPFYLAKFRPANTQINLFYYEGYEDKEELFKEDLQTVFQQITSIRKTPKWKYYPLRLLQELSIFPSLKGISLKHLPRKDDIRKAKKGNYDLIWIYTGLLYPWAKALQSIDQVMTGPDNLYLHHRLVAEIYTNRGRPVPGNVSTAAARKFAGFAWHRERRWAASKTLLHVVGEDDKRVYDELGAASHSFFSPHPYYDFIPIEQSIDQASGKLTVVVAGANGGVYTGDHFDEVVKLLIVNKDLVPHYRFVIIGKGFDAAVKLLQQAGFEVTAHAWVSSYEAALAGCHIQFFPIILGTGTKGKVLCALATGLLCIGSQYAFENIQFDAMEDAILLKNNDATGAVEAFKSITANRPFFAEKAKRAARKIRELHSPQVTAELFWQKVSVYFKEVIKSQLKDE